MLVHCLPNRETPSFLTLSRLPKTLVFRSSCLSGRVKKSILFVGPTFKARGDGGELAGWACACKWGNRREADCGRLVVAPCAGAGGPRGQVLDVSTILSSWILYDEIREFEHNLIDSHSLPSSFRRCKLLYGLEGSWEVSDRHRKAWCYDFFFINSEKLFGNWRAQLRRCVTLKVNLGGAFDGMGWVKFMLIHCISYSLRRLGSCTTTITAVAQIPLQICSSFAPDANNRPFLRA